MDIWAFIASVISSLAWPGTVFLCVILLRRPIAEIISSMRNLKFKDFEVEFGRRLEELETEANQAELPSIPSPTTEPPEELGPESDYWERIVRLSEISPRAVVSEARRRVELALDEYFRRLGQERPPSFQGMLRALRAQDRPIPPSLILFQELRVLGNSAVHARDFEIDSQRAIEFAQLTERIVASLETEQ
jgi:hypothetical protein